MVHWSLFGPAGAKCKWSSVGIRVILTSPAYIGNLVWNRRNGAKKARMRNPEEWIVVEGAHAPIIDKETFDLAGRILKGRRGVRNPVEDYMLRGMAKCADCGGSMCYYRQQWRAKNSERRYCPQLSCVTYHDGFSGESYASSYWFDVNRGRGTIAKHEGALAL